MDASPKPRHRPSEVPLTPELVLVSPELAELAPSGESTIRLEEGHPRATARAGPAPTLRRTSLPVEIPAEGSHRPRPGRMLTVFALGLIALAVVGLSRMGGPSVPGSSGPTASALSSSLLASSGYVVSPEGSFLTGSTGASIEVFTLPLRCGSRQLVIEDVPVSSSFRFRGKAVGRAAKVKLEGTVVDDGRLVGVVSATGEACDVGPVEFSARLS